LKDAIKSKSQDFHTVLEEKTKHVFRGKNEGMSFNKEKLTIRKGMTEAIEKKIDNRKILC